METPFVNIHTHRPTGHGIEPASVGIHPWEAAEGDLATVREPMSARHQVVGEIGLDYLRPDREAQLRIFEGQLRLAEAAGKPVVLHCVKAFEETMRLLKQFRLRAVIFHGFIGSPNRPHAPSPQATTSPSVPARCVRHAPYGHSGASRRSGFSSKPTTLPRRSSRSTQRRPDCWICRSTGSKRRFTTTTCIFSPERWNDGRNEPGCCWATKNSDGCAVRTYWWWDWAAWGPTPPR